MMHVKNALHTLSKIQPGSLLIQAWAHYLSRLMGIFARILLEVLSKSHSPPRPSFLLLSLSGGDIRQWAVDLEQIVGRRVERCRDRFFSALFGDLGLAVLAVTTPLGLEVACANDSLCGENQFSMESGWERGSRVERVRIVGICSDLSIF